MTAGCVCRPAPASSSADAAPGLTIRAWAWRTAHDCGFLFQKEGARINVRSDARPDGACLMVAMVLVIAMVPSRPSGYRQPANSALGSDSSAC
jgi:hypothetical protein